MTAESKELKPRLARLEMVYVRSPVYFVTACTENRRPILANESIHQSFIDFATRGEKLGAWVGRYVLMPDHLHLFVSLDDERRMLERWVKSLKNTLSKSLRSQGMCAPHWQKTFFDHVLRSGESYSRKWEYVRANPVRAKLVVEAETWPYAGEIFPLEFRKGS